MIQCRDRDQPGWAAQGETVYMVVEQDAGTGGDFTIDVTAEPASCNPMTYSCDQNDDLQYCQWNDGMPKELTFGCPDTCTNARCTGTSCSNPIEVTQSQTYSGNLEAFEGDLNFEFNESCRVGENNDVKAISGGKEVVFKVPMQKGQKLTVDSKGDEPDNLIFVTQNCPQKVADFTCEVATDDGTNDILKDWTAPKTATYWVIVDKWSLGPKKDFSYDIKIQ
jgi:hypothetical protein